MLYALLSPAKRLDFKPAPAWAKATTPALLDETAILGERAKKYTVGQIKKLMDLSDTLADLNHKRFQAFDLENKGETKAAAYAFAGDVYLGFDAKTLTKDDMAFAQQHIGILSGLYGLLRPLDAIQPYRLEMGSTVNTDRGKNLHAFWQEPLTAHVNTVLGKLKSPTLINLASDEYFDAVDATRIKAPIIHPDFREIKNGKPTPVMFFLKKARGMMARYIVEHRLDDPEQIKAFDRGGYKFDPALSKDNVWMFTRPFKKVG
jgi:cytoplasmic iron level regulating protein YaaA (DUF328/UPF0246 family)